MIQQEDPLRMHLPVQEVDKKIDEQQLEGIHGGALPLDVNTGQLVRPLIRHPDGRVEVPSTPPLEIVKPLDVTGRPVTPIVREAATGRPMVAPIEFIRDIRRP